MDIKQYLLENKNLELSDITLAREALRQKARLQQQQLSHAATNLVSFSSVFSLFKAGAKPSNILPLFSILSKSRGRKSVLPLVEILFLGFKLFKGVRKFFRK